jgi:hypothetical protein
VNAAGRAAFTWTESVAGDQRIQARTRSSSGALGPLLTISPAGQDGSEADVAVDADGDVVFAWVQNDGSSFRIQVRALSAAGVLGPVKNVSPASLAAVGGRMAMNPDGDAVVVWRASVGGVVRIQGRARSAAGVLGPVRTLSGPTFNASDDHIGIDAAGNATASWVSPDGSHLRLQARSLSAGGALSPIRDVSPNGIDVVNTTTRLGVDAAGDAVFAWLRNDHGSVNVVQARELAADGTMFAVQTVSDSADSQTAVQPQLAMGADGHAVAGWLRQTDVDNRFQAAVATP